MTAPQGDSSNFAIQHPVITVVGGMALFTIVGFVLSLIDGCFDPAKVGTLGEWAGGIGTTAAVLVALLGVRKATQEEADRKQKADEDEQAERRQRKRAQAQQVCAWFAGPYLDPRGPQELALVHIANQSTLPVYETWVEVYRTEDRGGWMVSHELTGVVGPSTAAMRVETRTVVEYERGRVRRPGVGLYSRDAAGKYWRRHPDGDLEQMSGPPHYDTQHP